jgi:hypothetical protein
MSWVYRDFGVGYLAFQHGKWPFVICVWSLAQWGLSTLWGALNRVDWNCRAFVRVNWLVGREESVNAVAVGFLDLYAINVIVKRSSCR